jgi:hypothetical protein
VPLGGAGGSGAVGPAAPTPPARPPHCRVAPGSCTAYAHHALSKEAQERPKAACVRIWATLRLCVRLCMHVPPYFCACVLVNDGLLLSGGQGGAVGQRQVVAKPQQLYACT